jgi:hypothetical protein
MPLAVKTAAVATPLAFVIAVFTPPAKVPLAPLAGAANVTIAPFTGLLKESLTVACSCTVNAALTVALCGVPAVAVIVEGTPAVPPAALKAASTAPQVSEPVRDAAAEASPETVWI